MAQGIPECCGQTMIDRGLAEIKAYFEGVPKDAAVFRAPSEFRWACKVCRTLSTD